MFWVTVKVFAQLVGRVGCKDGMEGVLGEGEHFCSARPPVYPLLLQHCHLHMLPQGWKSHRDDVSQKNPAHTETIAVTEVKNKLCSRREEEV